MNLNWHEGPANGGFGSAGVDLLGNAIWGDGDQLLILMGGDMFLVTVNEQDLVDDYRVFDKDLVEHWSLITDEHYPE